MAVLLAMNAIALLVLVFVFSGLRWIDIFQSPPVNIVGLAILGGVNWWLLGKVQGSSQESVRNECGTVEPSYLWAGYLFASVLFLLGTIVLATFR
jgi:hypothetical protein